MKVKPFPGPVLFSPCVNSPWYPSLNINPFSNSSFLIPIPFRPSISTLSRSATRNSRQPQWNNLQARRATSADIAACQWRCMVLPHLIVTAVPSSANGWSISVARICVRFACGFKAGPLGRPPLLPQFYDVLCIYGPTLRRVRRWAG